MRVIDWADILAARRYEMFIFFICLSVNTVHARLCKENGNYEKYRPKNTASEVW